jgi:hypothetical protein
VVLGTSLTDFNRVRAHVYWIIVRVALFLYVWGPKVSTSYTEGSRANDNIIYKDG